VPLFDNMVKNPDRRDWVITDAPEETVVIS
jgi:hypothetical protein